MHCPFLFTWMNWSGGSTKKDFPIYASFWHRYPKTLIFISFNIRLHRNLNPFSHFWSGIGIVNAIEVVHAFPEEDGLQHFREWLESPDPTILGNLGAQTGTTLKKRGPNEVEAGSSVSTDNIPKLKKIFMDKHVITMFLACFLLCWISSHLSDFLSSHALLTEKCEQKLAYSCNFSEWGGYFCIRLSTSGQINRTFLVGEARSVCSSQVSWIPFSFFFLTFIL